MNYTMEQLTMEQLVALAKRRGFVFPGSEIYGGFANTWDYGPLGVELKNNIGQLWWRVFVQQRDDMVGLDSSIILNPKVWEASGHVANFNDPLVDCKKCKTRHRGDKLLEEKIGIDETAKIKFEDVGTKLNELKISCPTCGAVDWTDAKKFNLLFETFIGTVADAKSRAYLRGETAQGIFINFKNILGTTRKKLPFGIAQTGKVFRNEITPGNFIFRTREFEQMEIEYFIAPPKNDSEWRALFEAWQKSVKTFFSRDLGILEEKLRWRRHEDDERAFYSKDTYDVEFNFPSIGWGEVFGLAYRTDYDLQRHVQYSGADLSYVDEEGNKFVPHCIEPSFGFNRIFLAVLCNAYAQDGERTILKLPFELAPYKAAVFPLLKNKPDLVARARKIYDTLRQEYMTAWDDRGNVGKRYYAQDEIGTPFCFTVDFQTLEDDTVTVRDRDTATQKRIAVSEIPAFLAQQSK